MHGGVEPAGRDRADLSRAMQAHFDESPGELRHGVGFGFGRDLSARRSRAGGPRPPAVAGQPGLRAAASYKVEWPSDKSTRRTTPLRADKLNRIADPLRPQLKRGAVQGPPVRSRSPRRTTSPTPPTRQEARHSVISRPGLKHDATRCGRRGRPDARRRRGRSGDAFGSGRADGGVVAAPRADTGWRSRAARRRRRRASTRTPRYRS